MEEDADKKAELDHIRFVGQKVQQENSAHPLILWTVGVLCFALSVYALFWIVSN